MGDPSGWATQKGRQALCALGSEGVRAESVRLAFAILGRGALGGH